MQNFTDFNWNLRGVGGRGVKNNYPKTKEEWFKEMHSQGSTYVARQTAACRSSAAASTENSSSEDMVLSSLDVHWRPSAGNCAAAASSFLSFCSVGLYFSNKNSACNLSQNEGLPAVPHSLLLYNPNSEVEVWFSIKMSGILHVTLWPTFSQAVKTGCWQGCGPEHLVKDTCRERGPWVRRVFLTGNSYSDEVHLWGETLISCSFA